MINSENNQKIKSKENVYSCTWLETESSRGTNGIGTALLHFLDIIDNRYKTLENPPIILNLYSKIHVLDKIKINILWRFF